MVCKARCNYLKMSFRGKRMIFECLFDVDSDVSECPKRSKRSIAGRDCFVGLRHEDNVKNESFKHFKHVGLPKVVKRKKRLSKQVKTEAV